MFQLVSLVSCLTTMHFQEEFVSIFSVSSKVVVDSKIFPLPSLVKAEQTHVSHPLLLCHMLQLSDSFCGPLLTPLCLCPSRTGEPGIALGSELGFWMWSHNC